MGEKKEVQINYLSKKALFTEPYMLNTFRYQEPRREQAQ